VIHLHVWLRPPVGEPIPAGEIVVADPDTARGGRLRGEFRYTRSFLKTPGAYALDPRHLPLGPDPIAATDPATGLHAVFEDSLPDAWGRAMLCQRYQLSRAKRRAPDLLALIGAEALGALAYTSTPEWVDIGEQARLPDLKQLLEASERFEHDPDAPMDALMRLFKAGSSPGGARPKVLVEDAKSWLAKFPSIRDTFDMVRIEATTLATARLAGIEVPEFQVVELGGRAALLVERFDVTPEGGRNHIISMKSLLAAGSYYFLGYADVADAVRIVSDRPRHDLQMLYRQAVFNALVANTDDHLKNFSMMRDRQGWHLTPAYDLMPDTANNREHVLHYGTVGNTPTLNSLNLLGRQFGVAAGAVKNIINEVRDAVGQFPRIGDEYGVPAKEIDTLVARMRLPGPG